MGSPVSLSEVSSTGVYLGTFPAAEMYVGSTKVASSTISQGTMSWERTTWPSLRAFFRRRSVGFSGSGYLGSIVAKKKSNPLFPMLRVYAEKAPGYLRAY